MATETVGQAVKSAEAAVKPAEKVISSTHVNGWLLIAVAVAANFIGVIFHV